MGALNMQNQNCQLYVYFCHLINIFIATELTIRSPQRKETKAK